MNGNATAGDGAGVDVNFRPDRSDEFNFTIQREVSRKLVVEAGYIGRIIRNEYNLINVDAVPTMTTLGGQTFANAFAGLYQEVAGNQPIQAQPFFEAALVDPVRPIAKRPQAAPLRSRPRKRPISSTRRSTPYGVR